MADVIVMGGSICGLLAALLLARDGCDVLVLDADDAPVPDTAERAWSNWPRRIPQFHQTHNFHPLFRHIVEAELPDVHDEMRAFGALRLDYLDWMPATITDRQPRDGDDRFWTTTGRRSTIEAAIAHAATKERRIDIKAGTTITGVLTGASTIAGVPHVTGVQTASGDTIEAEVVVDAMGRRSALPQWLGAAGAQPIVEDQDQWGFTYYTRYFIAPGELPQMVGTALNHMGTFSILTFPADAGYYSITLFASSADRPLKRLRDEDRWTNLVRACPEQAHWLDGRPVTGVLPMAGVVNRRRSYFVDGRPVATGVLPVGDAWASTNPSLGRGVSLGVKHAVHLRDAIRKCLGEPAALSEAWYDATSSELDPWYEAQVDMDRGRFTEMELLRAGREAPPPSDPAARIQQAMLTARFYDPDVFRGFTEIMSCLSRPDEVIGRPGMLDRIIAASEGRERPAAPSPTREQVLQLLS